jgi:hypothetical protein
MGNKLGSKRGKYKLTDKAFAYYAEMKGRKPWNYKLTKEIDERVARNAKNSGLAQRGRKQSEESNEKRSISCKKIFATEEMHNKMSSIAKEIQNRPETKENNSKKSKDRWQNIEYKEKLKKKHKENWQNNEYAKRMFAARDLKPNKTENFMDSLVQQARSTDFIYSGDGKIFIAGKVPDWFNVNGKKQIIELFGDYYHSEKFTGRTNKQEEKQRKDHFSKYGYDCLIIWEHELKEPDKVINKIKNF